MAEQTPVEVEVGEWKRGTRGVILRAQVITVGIGVALSNRHTGTGYLGFFTMDSVAAFQSMVRTAQAERGAPEGVSLWYSGGALLPPNREDAASINVETVQLQSLVNRVLDRSGFIVMFDRWLTPGKCLNMALRCGTQQCYLHTMDDPHAD